MKKTQTRRALLMSVLSLLLCCSMLIGTTFAWFTDTVESGKNQIIAGNLDVELYWSTKFDENGNITNWEAVDKDTNVFKEGTLWEPGHTEVVYLKVVNEGTLALKYNLNVNIESETPGINVYDEPFMLSDYIKYDVIAVDKAFTNRDAARVEADKEATKLKVAQSENSTLLPYKEGETTHETVVAMVVYMPTTVDNNANFKTGTNAPVINLGINLFATQFTKEQDSFGEDYDKAAHWTGGSDINWYVNNPNATEYIIESAEELAGFAALVNGTAVAPVTTFAVEAATLHDDFAGKTVKLGTHLDLNNIPWTPIGRIGTTSTDFTYSFKGTFNGQGYTISNLDVNAYGWAGLFGIAHSAQINNLTINGVGITANRMAGAVVGQLYGSINNCHVVNAEIKVTPNAVEGGYDNGDKVGGIVGWLGDNNDNRTLTNCSATDVELGAYRDVGGIAGYVASSTTVSGNKIETVKITVDQITNYYGDKDFNAGAVCGRTGGAINEANNTAAEDVTITSTFAKDGITYRHDGVNDETTLYLVPADYKATTVNVVEGTTNIGGYAFAYNSNIEKIVLPSTVTTLSDRAFRDTSASTVVLNEGLTNISYQAFRNASNVESVVIPSTVTTISKEAFQNSGVKELVIPANVTTIEYGGLRDMKELEKVTIEANVDIPVYAFRACTNLKTVILKGENVTFGCGSRGMIFTNKENGDGSAITVTVANEVVKARLLAADTAAKDYGGYTIICEHTADADGVYTDGEGNQYAFVNDGADMSTVIAGGADKVYLPVGNFVIPTTAQGKNLTVIGSGDTKIATNTSGSYEGCNYALQGATVVFENITINTDGGAFTGYAGCSATFNNCTINNLLSLYGDMVFNNCTFNVSGDNYNIKTWSAPTAVFNNCTFNSDGKALLLYGGANTKLTLNDCTFNDNGGLADKKAAVEIGNDYGTSYELIVNNTVVNGYEINDKGINTGSTLWGNKNSMGTDKLNVVVDGVDVY